MFSNVRADAATILAFLFAVPMAMVLFAGTPWGLGLSPDSVSYAAAARALAENHDLMRLPSHWPPMLPIMLAGLYTLIGDFTLSARMLQMAFLVLNVLLLYRLLCLSGQPKALTILLLILIVLQPDFIRVHLILWSEPAFLSLVLLDLLLLSTLVREDAARSWSFALAVTAGLAIMVRYAGLFLMLLNGAVLLIAGRPGKRFKERLTQATWLSLVTIFPLAAWSVFERVSRGHASDREIVWHPLGHEHMMQGINTLAHWFHLPGRFGWIVLVIIPLTALWLLIPWRARDWATNQGIATVLAAYVLIYPAFLFLSISLVDYHTPLDSRILVPMLPVTIGMFAYLTREAKHRLAPLGVLAAIILGLTLNLPESYQLWRASRLNGLGFANRQIQTLPIMSALRQMPPDWKVATNGPEFFQLYLRPRPESIPAKLNPGNQQPNPAFRKQIGLMKQADDAIVYFAAMRYRYYLPGVEELNRVPGFRLVYAREDGAIWVRDRSTGSPAALRSQ
jgi:4-amino-4-deoxy-L-arabinose transferase-like glycosyltransferase